MTGEGERLHAARRKRFWSILSGLIVLSLLGGIAWGLIQSTDGSESLPDGMLTAAAAGVILLSALFLYGSWRFFADVDEVELADNLWGSLVGFYTYAAVFPAWWALNKLELTPEPNDWAIFTIALGTGVAVYFYRKWR